MLKSPHADICLVLEGTYPYVRGGVSSWVHQILEEFQEFTFTIFFIGGDRKATEVMRYEVPKNVLGVHEFFLFEEGDQGQLKTGKKLPTALKSEFHQLLRELRDCATIDECACFFLKFARWMDEKNDPFDLEWLLSDPMVWKAMVEKYDDFCPYGSFIDYFWTFRFILIPLWKILKARHLIPVAGVYHSACTGYAGVLAALSAKRYSRPYILTEHGIYTKERIIEIIDAPWIYESPKRYFNIHSQSRFLKEMWIDFFKILGAVSYQGANEIISLSEGSHIAQQSFGAPKEKLKIIPNGINLEKFEAARIQRQKRRFENRGEGPVVSFIGRIVSIKDIKTLIRAAYLVNQKISDVTFQLFGPTEEEPEYFHQCVELAKMTGLENVIHFRGMTPIAEALSQSDIMVMTSISEGLPLVILEAFACEVPVVATDVGASRELILGNSPENKELGSAGFLTGISSPIETAQALINLLRSRSLQERMGDSGRKRVEAYYQEKLIMDQYRHLYRGCLESQIKEINPKEMKEQS